IRTRYMYIMYWNFRLLSSPRNGFSYLGGLSLTGLCRQPTLSPAALQPLTPPRHNLALLRPPQIGRTSKELGGLHRKGGFRPRACTPPHAKPKTIIICNE